MKFILNAVKRISLVFLILYSYNMIAIEFNLIIPINIITILLVGFIGLPALFALIFLFIFLY